MTNPKYYEDIEPGDELGPMTFVATTDHVRQFVMLQDPAAKPSRFTSDEVAREQGLPYAMLPGIMGMAYLSNLLTSSLPGAQVQRLDTVFRQSIPHNKPFKLVGTITDKNIANGQHRIECDAYIQKEDGENMMTANALLVVPSKTK